MIQDAYQIFTVDRLIGAIVKQAGHLRLPACEELTQKYRCKQQSLNRKHQSYLIC
jgi:hypothetical protein